MLFLLIWMPNPLVGYLSLLIISTVSEASHSQLQITNGSDSSLQPNQEKKGGGQGGISKFMVKYTFVYGIETQDSILARVR